MLFVNKYYITTSLPYVNTPGHLGHALEFIQADVLARYHRILGDDVFFLTGTDEHGAKIVRAAEKAGKTPKQFTDDISKKFKELTRVINLSNDDFIRTTDQKKHWPNVQKVWLKLKENNDIYKKRYKGFYCVGCEAFVRKKDLVDGKCPNHQKEPEVLEEENYFFKLSKYSKQVENLIKNDEIKIVPESKKNEILNFIEQGIEDVSCSRSEENLKWGIPVPGDDSQVIYVWFEALINYLFPKKYWPADVHCVGKDIFRFHALWWPAMLLALRKPLPKTILVHGFITSEGQKMSKSLGNVIDPFELVKKYGTDPVRYFLLREIPSTEDGDFTYEKFEARYNADLAKGLGNLIARVITLANKSKSQKSKITSQILKVIDETQKKHKKTLEEFKFNEALAAIWALISWCDKCIEREKLWETKDQKILDNLLFAIKEIAELLKPFLPETSEKILEQIKTKKSKPLFPRL
ncbi:MAG: methionine--tRNA ligase [Candidatus Nealsonbacteria bacterium CG09_land_8_20_14_0_10_42_14]|uniref:Methionine--tRNA ligase n=1 Tax=Candidatus Nealsonbacteria bacterium CG09_land_8_20_14_0_10_42_14 TaxID=1974707 RepID=A0A2H0WWY6_9BACT|nr:MAG: methionine--tRNA ligase [Candidatus Nealsonbacteria bacterium CG09_land_8_20_14_0_10_42_14]